MLKSRVYPGLVLLALTAAIAACGSTSVPVSIRTMDAGIDSCYTTGADGDLVTDTVSGTAIISDMGGQRAAVDWPNGWSGRSSGSGVEVLDKHGRVYARTGTHVSLMGIYNQAGDFEVCHLETIP